MRSNKPFRIHLFKVAVDESSMSLEDLLKMAVMNPLESRVRKLGHQEYRLEDIEPPADHSPFWRMDFCKLRYDGGPGKASPSNPVESIDLVEGEGFAEETAMLFHPKSGYAVVQYNHHGPRSGAIAEYLSVYDTEQPNDYQFLLQLNPDAQASV